MLNAPVILAGNLLKNICKMQWSPEQIVGRLKLDELEVINHETIYQRILDENTNGLIRQYFPKRIPFDKITNNDLQRVAKKINNWPHKCLNYQTPFEVFSKSCERWGVALGICIRASFSLSKSFNPCWTILASQPRISQIYVSSIEQF
jgi:IS30 family transposase